MIFSSLSFLYYFLPILLIIYFIVPSKLKNFILLLFSLVFYFYGEPIYILLMLGTILVSYICAILVDKYKNSYLKKVFFYSSVIVSIGSLCIFKYSDFFIENINNLFNLDIGFLGLSLPIGISFYTFQLLSYVIDVYKGKVAVQKSFLKLATYVSLFPQLIAGPIVRYENVEKELNNREHSFKNLSDGISRFVIGLGKKVIIANNLGSLCTIFLNSPTKSVLFYWIYGISFSLQIYFDFSAYSDMAIGLGRMFGFNFLENFNYPFISKSITEFWRRWHISLGSWFRDYVYIPLGGNRVGKIKLLRNIFIVWFLTGFWHGASWNFIIWGLMFGVLLIIEKIGLERILKKIPVINHFYVLFFIMISFIIFNAEDMSDAFLNIKGLFGFNHESFSNIETIYYLKSYLIILIISCIGATPILKNIVLKIKNNKYGKNIINILEPIFIIIIMIIVTAYLVDNSFNPFLYFRF